MDSFQGQETLGEVKLDETHGGGSKFLDFDSIIFKSN